MCRTENVLEQHNSNYLLLNVTTWIQSKRKSNCIPDCHLVNNQPIKSHHCGIPRKQPIRSRTLWRRRRLRNGREYTEGKLVCSQSRITQRQTTKAAQNERIIKEAKLQRPNVQRKGREGGREGERDVQTRQFTHQINTADLSLTTGTRLDSESTIWG